MAIIVALVAASGFAILKGGRSEQAGGIALLLALLLTKAGLSELPPSVRDWAFYAADVVLAIVFGVIAWTSNRSWPVWAAAFQAIALTVDVARATDLQLSWMAYVAASNLAGYGVDGALAVGAWIVWREREALSEFGVDARAF